MALLWSEPSVADAVETTSQESATTARFEDNSRCDLGSHWRYTTRKPSDYNYDADQIAEWVSSSGPTGRYVAPRFRCVSARLFRDPVLDHPGREVDLSSYDSDELWCGPGVRVLLIWEIYGGAPPYTVSAVGHETLSPAEDMLIPCTDIRTVSGQEQFLEHGQVNVRIRLEDAVGLPHDVVIPVRVLADVPSTSFDGMAIWAGWYDASAIVAPSDWRGGFGDDRIGGLGEERFGPFARVALGRFREVGSDNWTYFDLSVIPRQSAPSFYYPALMGPLEPLTQYEAQGTWMWATWNNRTFEWRDDFDPGEDWIPLENLIWSESQRFWSGGPACAEINVSGNSIRVAHAAEAASAAQGSSEWARCSTRMAGTLTWLTSPDWLGVMWAYGHWSRPSAHLLEHDEQLIAVYQGLPERSRFVLNLQEPLPSSFRQSRPQRITAVTGSIAATTGTDIDAGPDPRELQIRIGGDQIIVAWKDQSPHWHVDAELFTESGRWLDHATRWRERDSRAGERFSNLGGNRDFTLVVSFIPGERIEDSYGYPSMCVIRQIRLPAGGPDAYLDRYFTASARDADVENSPGTVPPVTVSYPWFYTHAGACELAWYAYP